ncbi:hypothetical protein [Acidipropionibacterium thoenii]|uniref:hypothetical protein n=1 Tax=Acidipropionibacterium thoenii TaxID=1751 RepID=UPI000414E553|nr:hypothetical protein [Acidipropionibacterium thoenii]
MTTLLIDIQLGPGSLGEVARRMGDAVAWPASTVPTIVAVMEAAQVLADVRADGRSWDAVVGLGYGCGPAAALVRDGAVGRAVLIDPPPMFAHNDFGLAWLEMATHGEPPAEAPCIEELIGFGLELEPSAVIEPPEFLAREVRRIRKECSGAWDLPDSVRDIGELIGAHGTAGPYPMEFYTDFVAQWYGARLTGDPALWSRVASIWSRADRPRQPNDETLPLQPEPDVVEAVDWMHAWQEADLDITVWLPVEHHPLVSALRRRAPGRPLAAKPWDALIWATAPEVLAAELAEAVGWVVPRS